MFKLGLLFVLSVSVVNADKSDTQPTAPGNNVEKPAGNVSKTPEGAPNNSKGDTTPAAVLQISDDNLADHATIDSKSFIDIDRKALKKVKELAETLQSEVEAKIKADSEKAASLTTEQLWHLILDDLEFVYNKTDSFYGAADAIAEDMTQRVYKSTP